MTHELSVVYRFEEIVPAFMKYTTDFAAANGTGGLLMHTYG